MLIVFSRLQHQRNAREHGQPTSGRVLPSRRHSDTDAHPARPVALQPPHHGGAGCHLHFQVTGPEVCAVPAPGHAYVPQRHPSV